jgi:hypothetical protein
MDALEIVLNGRDRKRWHMGMDAQSRMRRCDWDELPKIAHPRPFEGGSGLADALSRVSPWQLTIDGAGGLNASHRRRGRFVL